MQTFLYWKEHVEQIRDESCSQRKFSNTSQKCTMKDGCKKSQISKTQNRIKIIISTFSWENISILTVQSACYSIFILQAGWMMKKVAKG